MCSQHRPGVFNTQSLTSDDSSPLPPACRPRCSNRAFLVRQGREDLAVHFCLLFLILFSCRFHKEAAEPSGKSKPGCARFEIGACCLLEVLLTRFELETFGGSTPAWGFGGKAKHPASFQDSKNTESRIFGTSSIYSFKVIRPGISKAGTEGKPSS